MDSNILGYSNSIQKFYIVWVPPRDRFISDVQAEQDDIRVQIGTKGFSLDFADLDLIFTNDFLTGTDTSNQREKVCAELNRILNYPYQRVYFYGDSISEFVRLLALIALRKRIRICNRAEEGSVLQRYLKWFLISQ